MSDKVYIVSERLGGDWVEDQYTVTLAVFTEKSTAKEFLKSNQRYGVECEEMALNKVLDFPVKSDPYDREIDIFYNKGQGQFDRLP